ncbi:hypothetical protein [Bacillus anthracis]|uniref:hypothetical protein n=1 Tax=Bacillus anthracis TaxID=1392 RepID=UPI002DBFC581|nr:hypothetical protein [Bacillus anthracis]MEB9457379.1 hypothetical protein [Bacillus anthracis]
MITNSGSGEVETHLYFIENPGTSRLYELYIGAVTLNNASQAEYYGKIILTDRSEYTNIWKKLNAKNRQDALTELKNIVDKDFNK